jgi:hypothetical protein
MTWLFSERAAEGSFGACSPHALKGLLRDAVTTRRLLLLLCAALSLARLETGTCLKLRVPEQLPASCIGCDATGQQQRLVLLLRLRWLLSVTLLHKR